MLEIIFSPHIKVYGWFGLVWYGLVNFFVGSTLYIKGFQHVKGQFGVVFQGLSNGELKSAVYCTKQLTYTKISQ